MQNSKKPKFLLIGGFASSLINFRGPLLKKLIVDFEVYAAAPHIDEKTRSEVEAIGARCISTNFDRTGLNPLKDLRAYFSFRKVLKSIKPDYVLAYTIKPVIFGLRAAKIREVRRYALITGKGSAFDQSTFKNRLIRFLVKWLYRSVLRSIHGVIFQNDQDEEFFRLEKIIGDDAVSTVIKGTGVDLNYYKGMIPKDGASGKVTFLFVARLIREKGIPELLEAVRILRKSYSNFEVQLLGWIDSNPGGISKTEIEGYHDSGLINYLGTTDDIRPYMNAADIFVLPSYYNEGLPRTIQEAMAMAKPIITTDHPGCRETVVDGENGFLIPIKDSKALSCAMKYLIDNPSHIEKMGKKSLEMARERFDVRHINEKLFQFMKIGDV